MTPQNPGKPRSIIGRPPEWDRTRIEFHRYGMALLPVPDDPVPGVAFLVRPAAAKKDVRFCTCAESKWMTCKHLIKMAEAYRAISRDLGGDSLDESFKGSVWHRIACVLSDLTPLSLMAAVFQGPGIPVPRATSPNVAALREEGLVTVSRENGETLLRYPAWRPDCDRFVDRCGKGPHRSRILERAEIIDRLTSLCLTDLERMVMERGVLTRGQLFERSFWYRLGYHGFCEWGPQGCRFSSRIEESSGQFLLECGPDPEHPVFALQVPRSAAVKILAELQGVLSDASQVILYPSEMPYRFTISTTPEGNFEVCPAIDILEGDSRLVFKIEDPERWRCGRAVFVADMRLLVQVDRLHRPQDPTPSWTRRIYPREDVHRLLEDFDAEIKRGACIIDPEVRFLTVLTEFDRISASVRPLEAGGCRLDAWYEFGDMRIPLTEVLQSRRQGRRYVITPEGSIDCEAPAFEGLDPFQAWMESEASGDAEKDLRIPKIELFRFMRTSDKPVEIQEWGEENEWLEVLLDVKPWREIPTPAGMTSALRPYQQRGLEWITFLFENGFGGLLCDDMGLGKTHQVMAFMQTLRELGHGEGPFLVVCPTTVLSHWEAKVKAHIPDLKAGVYHGVARELQALLQECPILLTSYGILRLDIDALREIPFVLAVFDEIQSVKNPETLVHKAARSIQAQMKLGVTGTPIENSLGELKALMDLAVPGLLGTDREFETRFNLPIQKDPESPSRIELSRVIAPFALRRLKKTVLQDLPEKIEDLRTCLLSPEQVAMYRDALSGQGQGLLQSLQQEAEPIPYMHVFALLTALKQICDHPAILGEPMPDYREHQSGKWDLFKELLSESLDSGQKVVVYTQFLKMVAIMKQYLGEEGVDFVTLTGATSNRGQVIARFNTDPQCRVYVGSLKAGSTGIDLSSASVVIHYDRWWNAAREDQATDRVHRIGQTRGVQVFKLVTLGTLEEKISALIERKRGLMDSIVRESDPHLLRSFSREDLISLLAPPTQTGPWPDPGADPSPPPPTQPGVPEEPDR